MHVFRPALCVLALTLLATSSVAQTAAEVEIDRPADELLDLLVDPADPNDPDAVDSALVFTSTGGPAAVRCTAWDGNGDPIGSPVIIPVPAGGVRWIRASDLSNGANFVGSARCTTLGGVTGSAFLVGPRGATDLPAHQHRTRLGRRGKRYMHHLRFPVVASY